MFENPFDPVWLVAGAALAAVFGLAGLVLAVYAVRRRRPVLGVVLGVLAVAVLIFLIVAAGFMAIVLLLLGGAMDELIPAGARVFPLKHPPTVTKRYDACLGTGTPLGSLVVCLGSNASKQTSRGC